MNGGRALLRLDAFCESDGGEGQALALRYKGRGCGPVARGPVPRDRRGRARQALALRYKGRCCGPVARRLSVSPTVARDRPSPYGSVGN